jgi:phosphoglycolate phosphatase-like HAD superfamily hydrolase
LSSEAQKSFFSDRIVTGSEVKEGKPSPEGLLKLMSRLSASPQSSFYLGDSPLDMKLARSAQVSALGAAWAAHASQPDLLAAGADKVFSSVEEFRAHIRF